jgi:Family of unknown function (DUF6152)
LRRFVAILAIWAAFSPVEAFAHHSFAMFDRTKTVTLAGVVREFQWTNPHSWIQLLVTNPTTGETVEWSLEGGSPGILSRNGWKRTSLQAGDKVTIDIYPLKDGTPGGSFIEITKSDGSKLYYHG